MFSNDSKITAIALGVAYSIHHVQYIIINGKCSEVNWELIDSLYYKSPNTNLLIISVCLEISIEVQPSALDYGYGSWVQSQPVVDLPTKTHSSHARRGGRSWVKKFFDLGTETKTPPKCQPPVLLRSTHRVLQEGGELQGVGLRTYVPVDSESHHLLSDQLGQ